MNESSSIERTVLRRVHTIRVLRAVLSRATASCGLLLLSLYGIGREVWVARVLENAPGSAVDTVVFYMRAFLGTDFAVQLLVALLFASLVLLARETARLLVPALVPARA